MYVRWDNVVGSTLAQSSVTPAILRWGEEDGLANDVRVHVRLFGALASIAIEPAPNLVVPKPATLGDIVRALGERLGDAFLARVVDETGVKHRYCRLFVAGVPIEDLRTLIDADSVEIDMILLTALEGG